MYCSFMQMYNERIFDLLVDNAESATNPSSTSSSAKSALAIREHGVGFQREVFVAGLSEFRVSTMEDVMALLQQGSRNRVVRSTELNEASSRSHAILRLAINVVSQHSSDRRTVIRRAKLNLVSRIASAVPSLAVMLR